MAAGELGSRALSGIVRRAETAVDGRALRLEVVEDLRAVLGFDAYAWPLTDPLTTVGTAPVADVPWLSELPRQIRLKYLSRVNRWTGLDEGGVALLHESTRGNLGASRVWKEMLCQQGVSDVASVVFRDRHGCWAFLELWRVRGGAFTAEEAELLRGVAAVVTPALRRLQAQTFATVGAQGPAADGPVVLLLSPELEVLRETPGTQAYLRVLVPPAAGQSPVPASAYNVAAQLLAVEAGVDDHPPWARVHLRNGLWVTLRAARLGEQADGDLAVTIERSTPAERSDLLARAYGLSPRERELLGCLVDGGDTRDVARRMLLAESTVQDHLKSVFAKTGLRNRRTLLTRVLGT